jgi:hypothetical protein
MTCSDHGVCEIDESANAAFCSCFKYFSGADCQTQSVELNAIKTVDSIAVVISVLFIVAVYAVFILNDLLNHFLCKQKKLKMKKNKGKKESKQKKKKVKKQKQ